MYENPCIQNRSVIYKDQKGMVSQKYLMYERHQLSDKPCLNWLCQTGKIILQIRDFGNISCYENEGECMCSSILVVHRPLSSHKLKL